MPLQQGRVGLILRTDGTADINARVPATLVASVLLCLVLQGWLALVMEINWDEFFYLSHLYSYERGELGSALQTFHVHLFNWLTRIGGNEIDQIVAGRLVMLVCEAATCVLIYLLARLFVSPKSALMAVLAFASAGFTIIHGASFRADPLAACLMMGGLVVIARAKPALTSMAAAALLAAVAAMITVKVALYAPAFVGVAAWRILSANERKRVVLWLAGTAAATIVAFIALYLAQLVLMPRATNASSRASLGNAAQTQLGAGLLPRSREVLQFFFTSPVQVLLLLSGAAAAVPILQDRGRLAEALALIGCGATLLCLLFYRNAFPYFFPFILAPAALLAGAAVERIGLFSRHPLLLATGAMVPAAIVAEQWSTHDQVSQRQLLTEVHRIFPRAVAYIDRNSMVASFPKRGFFMSTWGMANYRTGAPVFANVLDADVVPLLIINGPALEHAIGMTPELPLPYRLWPRDERVLRENFIPHWGRIWVAGKRLKTNGKDSSFIIRIPGVYTLEGSAAEIDGKRVAPGATVTLPRGFHVVKSTAATVETLRWGNNLYKPTEPPKAGPIYRGF